jgi:O-antigen/teichoic acid export membrane protein
MAFLPMLERVRIFYWKLSSKLNRRLLEFSIPMVGISLVGVGNEILGRILLEDLCPSHYYPGADSKNLIGIYSGAAKIAVFINLGIQAYRYAADPFFFSIQKRKDTARYMSTSFTWFVAAGLFTLVGIQCNLDLIMQLFLRKPEFMLAKNAVSFLLFANFFIGVYYNLSFWYKFSGKTWWGTLISISGLGINALLNFLLVPHLGMEGAALSFLAGSLAMCIASWYLGRSEFPVSWEYSKTGLLISAAVFLCLIPPMLPSTMLAKWLGGILLPLIFGILVLLIQFRQIRKHAA